MVMDRPGAPDEAPDPRRHNLPAEISTFVGRDDEIAALSHAILSRRLVTLTGVGGVGKTRLGLRVAARLVEAYSDGIRLVELASLGDPGLVPRAVATALGVHEQPDRSMADVLADALRSQRLLLVFDNCEHLVGACADLISAVLRACPGVTILATSREPLGVTGELVWPVPPLSLPDATAPASPETVGESEAVRLFATRCADALPDFVLTEQNAPAVVEICRRLDGIPLAIELAAARVRGLPPEQIAARLDDRFRLLSGGSRTALPRHRTLHGAIEWSHDLLSEPERVLFRRLSVFAGGWSLEAAEGICSADGIPAEDVLDLLLKLVDRSLVVPDRSGPTARYRMLETIRAYAAERLREAGEESVFRTRHRDWWLQLAERIQWDLRGPHQGEPFDGLEADLDNIRAALDWCANRAAPPSSSHADAEAGLRLSSALNRFWRLRGHLTDNRRRLAQLLALAPSRNSARARALFVAAVLAVHQGDAATASELLEEGLPLAREIEDSWCVAFMLQVAASLAWRQGQLDRAVELGEESLAGMRAIGDRTGIGSILWQLAQARRRRGEIGPATHLLEESIAVGRETGDPWLVAESLEGLGAIAHDAGEHALACSHHEEALALRRHTRNRQAVARSLNDLGHLMLDAGALALAREHFLESLSIGRDIGVRELITRGLEGFAVLAAVEGQPERALRLAGAADAVRLLTGLVLTKGEIERHGRLLEPARRSLGEAAAATSWEAGRAMSVDEAIAYALATMPTQVEPTARRPAQQGSGLTPREREVAALVAEGLTNQQIADRLVIAKRTAANHVEHILARIGFHSRVQIASWVSEHGALDAPTSRPSPK